MKSNNIIVKTIAKGALCLSLLTAGAFASEHYTKVDRIKDMITMAEAMEEIQKGFMYRCEDNHCQKGGADKIIKVLDTLTKVDPNDFLDHEQAYAFKFAEKTRNMLEMYLVEMKNELSRGDNDEAMHNFSLALRQCNSCHQRLRK